MYQIIIPKSQQQLTSYFHFRWQQLKKPLGAPLGSERDEYDNLAEHRMICDSDGLPLAVGRLHFVSQEEAQIRHIAVAESCRGKGLGSIIMTALEQAARKQNAKRVVTFSRFETVPFFERCGYEVLNNPVIEHMADQNLKRRQMCKKLSEFDVILRQPIWCKELQQTWNNQIPISAAMGIKVHQYTGAQLEVRAALNANINLHNTMFAGSIYCLATLTGWGMVHLQMREQVVKGDIVLAKGDINYRKPITNLPRATVHINDVKGEVSALAKQRKAKLEVMVRLFDEHEECGQFHGIFVVLPPAERAKGG
ncbi:thioesterase domain-containing protein [Catenovulum agarivorans DS-2]|uniref:Thioesterase domain-containing protein n=1 Tax=Catenovulum agarivorans DS-2 TaxID=1328313 RepID=W7QG01_9ALTE|nr:bifunctional GNAT family N-acetyltransferase/hotdog fold thioesterase [Catenovulum agarivorans]EWH10826.1 thioesterase domain-containing protein [Catenovulum agarivorans DS-2]